MLTRRSLTLLAAVGAMVMSTVFCDVLDTRESDAMLESQNMTSIAAEATRFARNLTETAQESITPTVTPTLTPVPPTDTPVPTDLPPSVFEATDPSGDTFLCDSGQSVADAAVDILSVMVFDPPLFGSDHDGWLVRVGLGAPANQTYANDWSASLVGAFAPQGAPAYTLTVNEIHAGIITAGTLDEGREGILPGTADFTYTDDQGNIWYLIPRDTRFMQFSSFHSPTEDLPPEQKRCDIAPNDGAYTMP